MAPKDYSYTDVKDPSVVDEEEFMPSTIEDIDKALYDYINDGLGISCTTNKGWEKTPVIWVSPERAMHSKREKELQGSQDSFVFPAITIERTGFTKDLQRKGGIFGPVMTNNDEKGGTITIARKINQEKTQNFANAHSLRWNKQKNFPFKNTKIVYQTATIPAPIYVDVTYSLNLFSEYQQQMNEMMSSIINVGGSFNYITLHRNGHVYEAFIQQEYSSENNVSQLAEEERKYKTKIDIKVLGYIIGSGDNEERPKIVYRENAVSVKIGREKVVLGDIPDFKTKTTFLD